MTGVNYKKIRHYAPGVRTKQSRLDPDIAAILFKAGVNITSGMERLIADVSVKAAMPDSISAGNTDGKKRSLQNSKSSKNINIKGLVYDPTARKGPDTYLKLHVTDPERRQALMSSEPVPNFGWVKYGETNIPKSPPGVKVGVTRYKLDPRTGQPIKSSGYDPFDPFLPYEDKGIQVKGLGNTIGESGNGGKLIHFAARAAGVVVDALGKFRCPPGTPAANWFTNERGEGCFAVTATAKKLISAMSAVLLMPSEDETILGAVANVMQSPDRISIVQSLLAMGVSAAEIKRKYREGGIRGLASYAATLAKPLGGPDHLVGEKYMDPTYRGAIAPTLREAMRLTDGRVERMARVRAERKKKITALQTMFGLTPSGDDEKDMIDLLEAIGKDDRFGLASDGHEFYVGGTRESHQKYLRDAFWEIHEDAIRSRYGDMTPDQLEAKWQAEKGTDTPFARAIQAMLDRESQMRIGHFEQIALQAESRPEQMRDVRIMSNYLDVPGREEYPFTGLNGMAGDGFIYVGSGPAVQGWRDAPPEGTIDIYEATGGLQEQQWAAIAAAIQADETGRYWAHTYSVDLAAMHGEGWRDFGSQAAAHECYHQAQIYAISQYVKRMRDLGVPGFDEMGGGKEIDDMTSKELMNLANEFLQRASPQHLREALGADIEDVIDSRLDGVAGKYSGDVQQMALRDIADAGAGLLSPEQANGTRSIALLETVTELAANREVGLIGDDPELDKVIDAVYGPISIVPGSTPAAPGGGTAPDGPLPDVPDGAPTPSTPPIGPSWWTPSEIDVVAPEPPESRTPESAGGRHDPFGRRRKSIISQSMRDGMLTTQMIDELINGRKKDELGNTIRPNGLLFNLDRVLNGQLRHNRDLDSLEVQERESARKIVKTALQEMGINEEEIKQISEKILKREILSSEEESKLVNAITNLWVKQEEIKEEMRQYEIIGTDKLSRTDKIRYDALKRAKRELGQSFISPINDLWEINEFHKEGGKYAQVGPGGYVMPSVFPDIPEDLTPQPVMGGMASASGVANRQNLKLSADEISTISAAIASPPESTLSQIDRPGYISDSLELDSVYSAYGLSKPGETSFSDTETVVPALRILDKSDIDEDLIVDAEIDIGDSDIGSEIDVPEIHKTRVFDADETESKTPQKNRGKIQQDVSSMSTEDISDSIESLESKENLTPQERIKLNILKGTLRERKSNVGFASSSGGRIPKSAGIARRILNSRSARKAMSRIGIDPDDEDLVSLAAETAIAFSAGGPAAAIVPIARRGSKDAAEKMLNIMVKKGWIDHTVAQKIKSHGLDRIAKDGLPDEILTAIKNIGDTVNTEENKAGALRMIGVLQERADEIKDSAMRRIGRVREKISGKSMFDEVEVKILGSGIGKNNQTEKKPEKQGKKQKVRIVVPAGSKGKVEKSGDVLLPPGKIKVTGFDEDGVAEAEVTKQHSATDYLRIAEEKLAKAMEKSTDERAKQLIASGMQKYKKSKRDLMISSNNNPTSSVSKLTLEKAQGIIDDANERGYALFNDKYVYVAGEKVSVSDYYDLFVKAMKETIGEIREDAEKELIPENKKLNNFIKSNTDDSIYSTLIKISGMVFGDIDRRARISMSMSSLNQFLGNGRIANADVDSKMLSELKKNRDKIIGGNVTSSEFSLTPVDLIHASNTRRLEQSLYLNGTRVGSEEFADYGRGIEIVIRSENSKRIGYGRSDSNDNEGFYSLLTDDSQQRTAMTIFGNVVKRGNESKELILSALDSYLNKDFRGFLKSNGDDVFEGFIVGEISLNDVEHLKIPVSIFNIEKKGIPDSNPIGGKNRIVSMLQKRGMSDLSINEFLNKGGMIGGGYNPRYITYLLQIEAASELKEKLLSMGIPEVVFTNKNGVDIMAEQTWVTPPPDVRYGVDALRLLAKLEIDGILEKTAPMKKKKAGNKS